MEQNTTKLFVALFAWILLLHPQDLHAEVCNEKHLNSTATAIHMDMTILKYKVECLVPHGAAVIIKGRKTYKEDKVRVQIQNQSLILSSDPHPASCRLIWTDPGGRKHAENCVVTQNAHLDLSVPDKGQASAPTETRVEISSVGGGRKMRERLNISLYLTISLFVILVLYHVLKKVCKKRICLGARSLESATTSNSSELLMLDHRPSNVTETTRTNMLGGRHTWHGNDNQIIGTARSGSTAAALLDTFNQPNTVQTERANERDALLTNGHGDQVEDSKMNYFGEMEPHNMALASPQRRRLMTRRRAFSSSS